MYLTFTSLSPLLINSPNELNVLPRVERQIAVAPHTSGRLFPARQCLIYDFEVLEDITTLKKTFQDFPLVRVRNCDFEEVKVRRVCCEEPLARNRLIVVVGTYELQFGQVQRCVLVGRMSVPGRVRPLQQVIALEVLHTAKQRHQTIRFAAYAHWSRRILCQPLGASRQQRSAAPSETVHYQPLWYMLY